MYVAIQSALAQPQQFFSSPHYSPHSWHLQQAPSSHQSSAFAQSVFQQSAPSALYPTPPPPGISTSSSSLAFALGEPAPKPTKNVHRPSESSKFFDNFLAQQSAHLQQPRTPHRPLNLVPKESPDPLAFSSPSTHPPAVTPRKRKAALVSESSPAKRVRAVGEVHTTPRPRENNKLSLSATSTPKQKLQVYVELPPVPKSYRTPSRSQSGASSHRLGGSNDDEDLGGFGSDDLHDTSVHLYSSGRGTSGDERGT